MQRRTHIQRRAPVRDVSAISASLAARPRAEIAAMGRPRAAVLVALCGPGPDYRLLYTVRSFQVEYHKGEVSFPGGSVDPGDRSPEETALRESFEELGIERRHVQVLGLLDDTVTGSNFVVTPVVGRLAPWPYAFRLDAREVAGVLEVPVSQLRDPGNQSSHLSESTGSSSLSYEVGGAVIWGATARITERLLALAGAPGR